MFWHFPSFNYLVFHFKKRPKTGKEHSEEQIQKQVEE